MAVLSSDVQARVADLVALRRDLHKHPELGYQEIRTSKIVEDRLRALGFSVRTGFGKTGVTGFLAGGRPGRTVLIRADMDALPIQEETEVPWRSVNPGVMHACAHDTHVAMALTAADVLAKSAPSLAGNLFFVFQPAEETAGGAEAMLRDGALDGVKADSAVAIHTLPFWPAGTIAIRNGATMASADKVTITVTGKGGHAASPHLAVDPVVAAAQVIMALQNLISRETPPLDVAILSVTMLRAGTAFNIIPDTVEMTGTLRCFSPSLREQLVAGIVRTAEGVARALRCTAEVRDEYLTPAVLNDPAVTKVVREAAAEIVSADRVIDPEPLTGSEDAALFWQRVPGCYAFLGAGPADGAPGVPIHNAKFDIDESALPIGVEFLVRATRRLLQSP
jgi:amidohydrolase